MVLLIRQTRIWLRQTTQLWTSYDPNRRFQDRDNWVWIRDAEKNKLVVGTQCRILYPGCLGRRDIALKFNDMVRKGEIGSDDAWT